jgi:hypothetical protein
MFNLVMSQPLTVLDTKKNSNNHAHFCNLKM